MSNISEQLVKDLRARTGKPKVREPIYKIGDKIKMVEHGAYTFSIAKKLAQLDPPFVMTIKKTTTTGYYHMEENGNFWWKGNIECLYIEPIPIKSRFELLDIR